MTWSPPPRPCGFAKWLSRKPSRVQERVHLVDKGGVRARDVAPDGQRGIVAGGQHEAVEQVAQTEAVAGQKAHDRAAAHGAASRRRRRPRSSRPPCSRARMSGGDLGQAGRRQGDVSVLVEEHSAGRLVDHDGGEGVDVWNRDGGACFGHRRPGLRSRKCGGRTRAWACAAAGGSGWRSIAAAGDSAGGDTGLEAQAAPMVINDMQIAAKRMRRRCMRHSGRGECLRLARLTGYCPGWPRSADPSRPGCGCFAFVVPFRPV